MRTRKYLPLLVVLAALLGASAQAQIAYVKMNGTGSGASWDDATGDLQEAIDAVGVLGGGDVWVAAGVYVPDAANDSFYLDTSVSLYGGFPANATSGAPDSDELADRRPKENLTILSGDRNSDDVLDGLTGLPTLASMQDNAARVLDISGVGGQLLDRSGDTVVDGFVIEGGNADNDPGQAWDDQSGGGIRATIVGGEYRATYRLAIRNCEIARNRAGNHMYAGGDGGGVYVDSMDVLVQDSTIAQNAAGDGPDGPDGNAGEPGGNGVSGGEGGGMIVSYCDTVTIDHVHFDRNFAGKGGDGGNGGDSSTGDGGRGGDGAHGGSGGGLYLGGINTSITITGSGFSGNQAGSAGDGGDGGDTSLVGGKGGDGGNGKGSDIANWTVSGCGGGLAIAYSGAQPILITSSTFMENASGEAGQAGLAGYFTVAGGYPGLPGTSSGGGGEGGAMFLFEVLATMENTTVAKNKAAGNGGGIGVSLLGNGGLVATHTTVFGNTTDSQGGGLSASSAYSQSPQAVTFHNSVFWGNSTLATSTGALDSDIYSLYSGITIAHSTFPNAPATVTVVGCDFSDPQLKAFSANGGPTPTMAPNPGSPIINATFVDVNKVPSTDQRGFPRDDGFPDAGAFELRGQASGVTMTAVTNTTATATWTPGVWGHSVVFVRSDDPGDPKPVPADGNVYNHDGHLGNGGYITGTPWSCVYAGTDTSVAITGLTASTKYTIMVCDTLTPDYVHNTEDAADNPLVFETGDALAKATLVSPVHCPDEGAAGPDGDNPMYGHSLIPEPVFVWDPPANSDGAEVQVWLDGAEIGDTAINPIGFRCFDGTTWTDFPEEGGMPSGTQRLAFLRDQGGEKTEVTVQRAISTSEREWWVVTIASPRRSTSESDHWRFLVESVTWEDSRPVAGITLVRKAQIDQLREETNALQRLRGLPETAFVDPAIAKNETPILAAHFQELRDAIRQAADMIGEDTASWAWTDPVLTPNQTVIRATHLQELHDALAGLYPVSPAPERR